MDNLYEDEFDYDYDTNDNDEDESDDTSILDVMCICQISIIYDGTEPISYYLTDIRTGLPVEINSEIGMTAHIHGSICDNMADFIKHTNIIPTHMILIGNFYVSDDGKSIEWDVDDLCIFTFLDLYCTACTVKLDEKNNNGYFVDVRTNKLVGICDAPKELSNHIARIMGACAVGMADYSLESGNRLLFVGNLNEIDDKFIIYQYEDSTSHNSLMFGDMEALYEFFMKRIKSEVE